MRKRSGNHTNWNYVKFKRVAQVSWALAPIYFHWNISEVVWRYGTDWTYWSNEKLILLGSGFVKRWDIIISTGLPLLRVHTLKMKRIQSNFFVCFSPLFNTVNNNTFIPKNHNRNTDWTKAPGIYFISYQIYLEKIKKNTNGSTNTRCWADQST